MEVAGIENRGFRRESGKCGKSQQTRFEATGIKTREKHLLESTSPRGKLGIETTQGRADVGKTRTSETLGTLACNVLSGSMHAESPEQVRIAKPEAPNWD